MYVICRMFSRLRASMLGPPSPVSAGKGVQKILLNQEKIMSQNDDLLAAVARNTSSVNALIAAVQGAVMPVDLTAQIAAINATSDAADAETAALSQ